MAREERNWHPNFLAYMEFIVNHKNYQGLPILRKSDGSLAWIATAKSEIGKARKKWALGKAEEFGFKNEPGVYANVMLEVHPTKEKVCQVCGKSMSIYYIYPNKWMVQGIAKEFGLNIDTNTSIIEVVKFLLSKNYSEDRIKNFLIERFKFEESYKKFSLSQIIPKCEEKCRNGNSAMLGPGAMSNFPDRYDGFHTYNRCCRGTQDTGRSAENLRTYTKDRRAYEYWSDGNIHAANKFMGSYFFEDSSADHIGPISLGFVHDPIFLQRMSKGVNSSKRDRLLFEDIDTIIAIENQENVNAMSWFSDIIWNFIKLNFRSHRNLIEPMRLLLKQNMTNFMYILWEIITNCEEKGIYFLTNMLLIPKYEDFQFSYKFDSNGKIVKKLPRNITKSTEQEFNRFVRIAFQSVDDYNDKENRNVKHSLDKDDIEHLTFICQNINYNQNPNEIFKELRKLMSNVQNKLISTLY